MHSPPASRVAVRAQRQGERVSLFVDNEGRISAYVRERLFRRFVTTRGDKGGTGLGLAIVRAVAEAHAGRVELVSAGPSRVEIRLDLPAA